MRVRCRSGKRSRTTWNKEPYAIRRMLTETSVRASDRRAFFVGVDAYEAAGGVVLRDLFQGDDGGWLEDPALLDRLVTEKLQAEAEALASEGRKWIEVATHLPYGYSHDLRRLAGDPAPMTDEESAAHAVLLAEYRTLEEEYSGQDECPEEIDARLGQLEMAMAALEQRPLIYDPAEVGARASSSRWTGTAVSRSIAAMSGPRTSLARRPRSKMVMARMTWGRAVMSVVRAGARRRPSQGRTAITSAVSRSARMRPMRKMTVR